LAIQSQEFRIGADDPLLAIPRSIAVNGCGKYVQKGNKQNGGVYRLPYLHDYLQ
jgi:hypothetical protein